MAKKKFAPNKVRRTTASAVSAVCGNTHLILTATAKAVVNVEASAVSRLLKVDGSKVKAERLASTNSKIARAALAIKVLKGQATV